MKGMLGWSIRSAKRNVCRYGCCLGHEKNGAAKTKVCRQREKRSWKKTEARA
jgi:hypothetical protein